MELCQVAIRIMAASVDPNHDEDHVYALLSDLNRFLDESDEVVKSKLNLKALTIAICWHDTWKSTRPQTINLIKFLFEQFWDGFGYYLKFKSYLKALDEDQKPAQTELDLIAYLIRRHARFDSFIPRFLVRLIWDPRSVEARILRDLDHLEIWNIKRMQHLEEYYIKNKQPRGVIRNRSVVMIMKVYLHWQYRKDNDWKFYYNWSVKLYHERKAIIWTEFHEVWKRLHSYYKLPYKLIDQY